jgi:hypothetical protein
MTILAVLTFIAILYYCGFGLVLLLFSPKESPWRLAIMPALGLCAHIVFSIFLAQFSLTGRTISIMALPFFGVVAALGWRRNPISRAELRAAVPALLLGLFSVAAFGWPLFYSGMQNYWGLANPDQGFLIPVMEWTHTHILGIPPEYARTFHIFGGYRDIPLATLLGVFYVASTLSVITTIPIGLLFNVIAIGLVYLVPGSVYALAESLGLSRRICLTASVLVACSSLVAYTFYLDSLGAISVIAIIPVACVLTVEFVGRPNLHAALALGLLCAGMFYEYIGMIGMMGVLVGTALIYGLLTRAIPLGRALLFVGSTTTLIFVLYAPFAASTLRFFFQETFGARFGSVDESQLYMALFLTDYAIPFFWGLRFPAAGAWPFVQNAQSAFMVGAVFCLMLLFVCCYRRSNLPLLFRLMLAAATGVILLYAYRGIGYGVFKLVAWVHPLMVVGLTASVFALSDWLFSRRRRVLGWVILFALPLYAVPNLALALRIGFTTAFPTTGLRIHNAPSLSFRDVREIRPMGERWGSEGIVATLPDSVATGWAKGYLHDIEFPQVPFFPIVALNVIDSQSRRTTSVPSGRFLLRWNDPELDVVPLPDCPAVWSNKAFALSPLEQCRNTLVVGLGWYRVESSDTETSSWMARFRWLRKRGELLVINPSNRSQRLRMVVIAGPGNASPSRRISVLLNGGLIDRLEVTGAAQLVTKAFVASGASSQIEILVEQDAETLPRRRALWNRWVPADSRRLNVAVTSMALVDADLDTGALSSSFDLASPNQNGILFNGFFLDRWMGADATVTLASPAKAPQELSVIGTIPGGVGLPFPFHLTPSFNGVFLPPCEISRAGVFRAHCPIPDQIRKYMRPGQAIRIDLKAEKTFTGGVDPRQLSLRLDHVELAPLSPERR